MTDILPHDRGTGQQDLSFFTIGQFFFGAGSNDLDIGIRERNPDASFFGKVGRGQAAGRNGFGSAVPFPHLNGRFMIVQEGIKFLFEFGGKGIPAGEHTLQTAQIRIAHAGKPQQCFIKSGYTGNEVAAILGNELRIALSGKPGHQNTPSALRKHGMNTYAQPKAMEQGHGGQHLVSGAEHGVGGNDLLAQSIEVLVGQQNAFGGACRSAGIKDHGRILRLAFHPVVPETGASQMHKVPPADHRRIIRDLLDLTAFGKHIARPQGLTELIGDAGNDNIHHRRVLTDSLELVVKLIQRNYGNALALLQVKLDLLFRRQRMDHITHSADQVHGIEHKDSLRAIGHGNSDSVSIAHTDGAQRAGAAVNLFHHALIGRGTAHKVKSYLPGIHLRNTLHGVEHGALEVIQMHGDPAHKAFPGGLAGGGLAGRPAPVQLLFHFICSVLRIISVKHDTCISITFFRSFVNFSQNPHFCAATEYLRQHCFFVKRNFLGAGKSYTIKGKQAEKKAKNALCGRLKCVLMAGNIKPLPTSEKRLRQG